MIYTIVNPKLQRILRICVRSFVNPGSINTHIDKMHALNDDDLVIHKNP